MIIKLVSLALVLSFVRLQPATAHFFVSDDKTSGAIVHISPDDDPIAVGEISTIHFDISSDTISTETHFLSMDVTEPSGERTRLSAEVVDTFVIGEYQFKRLGAHTITLVATNKNSGITSTFEHIQEVTRSAKSGVVSNGSDTATMIIAAWSFGGLFVLALIAVMRKRATRSV